MTVASIEEPKTLQLLKLEDMGKVELAANEKKKKKKARHPMIACLEKRGRLWRSLMWRNA